MLPSQMTRAGVRFDQFSAPPHVYDEGHTFGAVVRWFSKASGRAVSRIHGALITLTTAALLSACSSDPGPTPTAGRTVPVAPHDAPAGDVGTPALDQWPPIPARSDEPAGVTLRLDDGSIVLANRSARSVWLAPPQVETWFGGSPWVSSDDPKPGAVWVPPGGEFRQARPRRTDTVRVGVRLWDHASPDPAGNEAPWFVWLEVPGASP